MDEHEVDWVVDSLTDNIDACEQFALPIESMKNAKEMIINLRAEVKKLYEELMHEKYMLVEYMKQPYIMWTRYHKETGFIKTDLAISPQFVDDVLASVVGGDLLNFIAEEFITKLKREMNRVKV